MLINNYKIITLLVLLAVLIQGCKKDGNKLPVNNAPIPRIIAFVPENAGPGDLLTIKGLNFSTDPEKNIVRFNQTIVVAESVSDTAITVVVPELTTKTAGVTVRSNGKISNKKNLNLAQVKKFTDDFNRADVGPVDKTVVPNPIGTDWELMMGQFELEDNRLATHEGGVQTYMLYRGEEADMKTGNGNFFKFSTEFTGSSGSFGGIIFNAQEDGKRFYLLRIDGSLVQLLKTGNNGLDDWAAIMINGNFEGLAADTRYKIEVSSSTAGQIILKITNISTNGLAFERTVEDANPYTGGVPGYYYFGLSNPVNIYFDNFSLELQ